MISVYLFSLSSFDYPDFDSHDSNFSTAITKLSHYDYFQYWSGEEERIFKVTKAVSGPPRSSVSLLSSNLVVEQGPIEISMFGQK